MNSQCLPLLARERRMPWTQLFNSSFRQVSGKSILFCFFFLCNPADRQMSPLAVATKQKQRQPFPYKRTKLHIVRRQRLCHRLSYTATTSMNSRQHGEGQQQPSRKPSCDPSLGRGLQLDGAAMKRGVTLHSSARRPFSHGNNPSTGQSKVSFIRVTAQW